MTPPCPLNAFSVVIPAHSHAKGVHQAMPTNHPGAAIVLTAAQIRGATIGATLIMIVVDIGGLAISVIIGGQSQAIRIAYTSAFVGLLLIGLIVIVVATLRGQAAVIRHQARIEAAALKHFAALEEHQRRIEKAANDHFTRIEEMIDEKIDDGIQDRLDQIEHLGVKIHETQQRQSTLIGDMIEHMAAERNEIACRRQRRNV